MSQILTTAEYDKSWFLFSYIANLAQTAIKALIEEGLRLTIESRKHRGRFRLRKAIFKGNGLQPDEINDCRPGCVAIGGDPYARADRVFDGRVLGLAGAYAISWIPTATGSLEKEYV